MRKLKCVMLLIIAAATLSHAQGARTKSRPAQSNVTGSYRVRHRTTPNTLDVLLLPDGKIKFQLSAYWIGNVKIRGANTGEAKGVALLQNGVAVFEDVDGKCRIRMRFTRNKVIVTQQEEDFACGFGFNVTADGTYLKQNSRTPKFDF